MSNKVSEALRASVTKPATQSLGAEPGTISQPSPDTEIKLSVSVTVAYSFNEKKQISENNERSEMNLRKTKNPNSRMCLLICE